MRGGELSRREGEGTYAEPKESDWEEGGFYTSKV